MNSQETPVRRSNRFRWLVPGLAALVLWAGFEWWRWPDVAAVAGANPSDSAFVRRWEEKSGEEVDLSWVEYGRIAESLKRAVVVSEDINFFSHSGFDWGEVRNAIDDAIERREAPRGASTLTQQLAKNLWLSPSRSPLRKAREFLLTRQLEEHLSKRRILEVYLNIVEFGEGVFGCGAASRHFFGKSASSLTRREAARLAAVLPRPRSWRADGQEPSLLVAVERIERRMERASWLRGHL